MKSVISLAAALCLSICVQAQTKSSFRKLRPDEITYFNALYANMYAAIPHEYKDWKPVGDAQQFNISDFWCKMPMDGQDCTNDCPKSLGIGEPYTLSCYQDLNMADGADMLKVTAMQSITDYNNQTQIAAALKMAAKSKVQIHIYANLDGIEEVLSYCGKTPPQKIALPVPAALALKGIHSTACPIMQDGRVSTSADYYDNALIILGKPVASKHDEHISDGLERTWYKTGFDHSKIGKPVTQNIVITIKGDAADIDAIIAMIDWNRLNGMIGK